MRSRSLLFPIALVVLLGCPSPKSSSSLSRSFSLQQMSALVERDESILSLKGEGQISIETPTLAQSATFTLALRKPDTLFIRLRGPFGISVGWLFATRSDFTFYNAIQNQLVTGPSSQKNLERVLHANLGFTEILNVFCGASMRATDVREPDQAEEENGRTVYLYREPQASRRYTFDETGRSVVRLQLLDKNGKLTLEQAFANFQETGAAPLPFNIRILQPRERQFVSVFYSSLRVNEPSLDFSYSIPKNVERVRW